MSEKDDRRKVLLVEDDPDITRLVRLHLEDTGYYVQVAENGDDGYDLAAGGKFDLIILDLMLPGIDGLDICRRLRSSEVYTPILMLTAKSTEIDRVIGLEMGADDYLTKPFSIRELVARVKAIFRRVDALGSGGEGGGDTIRAGGIAIDQGRHTVTVDGRDVHLTAREFDLLVHFARSPGRVYTRAQLLDSVWGYGYDGFEHTVNTHINRLRAKIEENPEKPRFIETVWGVGYRFAETAAEDG
jgi:DNA-binding response OmpR family regulator